MKLLHNTKNENVESILSTGLLESEFDVSEYIKEFLKSMNELLQTTELISHYDESKKYVPWLGKGIYCYSEFDIREAKNYKFNQGDRAVISVMIDDSINGDENFFNMDSLENRKLIREFLTVDLHDLLLTIEDEQERSNTTVFFDLLLQSFESKYVGYPFAAGIIIDMLSAVLENKKIMIARGNFQKGGGKNKYKNITWTDTYFVIKNKDVISSLSQIC